ncbi:hypothetical protein TCAL_14651 [Tigriopus californicus]|uniref:BZIP domain-containing protein n=1 Tax=Tigriopus californicus TaxID=6832 RepID=A0A553P6V4_TIGCA|nr:hypothetical protein TCAL_14651 [Tigriopus californicus]
MASNPVLAASPPDHQSSLDGSTDWPDYEPLPDFIFSPCAMDTNNVFESIGQSDITKDSISPCDDVPVPIKRGPLALGANPKALKGPSPVKAVRGESVTVKDEELLVPKAQIRGDDLYEPLLTIDKSDLLKPKVGEANDEDISQDLLTPFMANTMEDSNDESLNKGAILSEADPSVLNDMKRDLLTTAVAEGAVNSAELLEPPTPMSNFLNSSPIKKLLDAQERAILDGKDVVMDFNEDQTTDSQNSIDIPSDLVFPPGENHNCKLVTARKSPPNKNTPEESDEDNEVFHDDSDDEDFVPRKPRGRGRPRRTRKRTHGDSSSSRSKESKKRKLYECAPFKDPVKEKKRLDAINAKQNRDRKKREKMALVKQMDLIRKENEAIKEREQQMTRRALKAEKTCEALVKLLVRNNLGHLVNINGQSLVSKVLTPT